MLDLQLPRPLYHGIHSIYARESYTPRSPSRTGWHSLERSIVSRDDSGFGAHLLTPPSDMNASVLATGGSCQYSSKSTTTKLDLYPVLHGAYDSKPMSRAPSQSPRRASSAQSGSLSGRNNSVVDAVSPSFQIPFSISCPQTNIGQLAAELTCLFWFESYPTLQRIEVADHAPAMVISRVNSTVEPTASFRKWVSSMLSTTQVAQNVTLLALLFIYRLKQMNKNVRGKPGSEYRLMTVALMLGNKFLDDNTYTNKTWAEVSGIAVQEIHLMEVEFLSNMRYNLFVTEEEWKAWHVRLGKFARHIDLAVKLSAANQRLPTTTLPSPPASNHTSPPFPGISSPSLAAQASPSVFALHPQSSVASSADSGVRMVSRKRSYDDRAVEPPSKRIARASASQPTMAPSIFIPSSHAPNLPRLPSPTHSITSTQTLPLNPIYVPHLPPLATRTMSFAYQTPLQWSHPTSLPNIGSGLVTAPPSHQPSVTLTESNLQLSPFPFGSGAASPTSAVSVSAQPSHTPTRLSPSHYLIQRTSPYGPVRGVTTLLVPPPPSSVFRGSKSIATEQMQYQSLGRPMAERHAGHVPYVNHDAWPNNATQWSQWRGSAQS